VDREKIIKKFIGKNDFKLSDEVPNSYLIKKAITYIVGLCRGNFRKVGMKGKKRKLFIGKYVQLNVKNKITVGDNVRICSGTIVDALSTEGVFFGDRVKIGDNSKILCTGSLSNIGKGLRIGSDSSFAENTFFGAAGGIEIGKDVIAGQNVRFHSENHNFSDSNKLIRLQGVSNKGIKIGNNVWIGSGVVILDGSIISDGCVIAANAVVRGKYQHNLVIGGIPSKCIRRRIK